MENYLLSNNENNEAINDIEAESAFLKIESPSTPCPLLKYLSVFNSMKVKCKAAFALVNKHASDSGCKVYCFGLVLGSPAILSRQ